MEGNKTVVVQGVGVLPVLGVAFVVLKLCGVIGWSWWWVTAPFWGGIALAISILLVCLVVAGVCLVIAALLAKR